MSPLQKTYSLLCGIVVTASTPTTSSLLALQSFIPAFS